MKKHEKTVRFSDVFGGKRKGTLGTNGLIQLFLHSTNMNTIANIF